MFLMANGVNALFSGFEFSYHTKVNTSFLKQYLNSLGVALMLALFLFLAVITIPEIVKNNYSYLITTRDILYFLAIFCFIFSSIKYFSTYINLIRKS